MIRTAPAARAVSAAAVAIVTAALLASCGAKAPVAAPAVTAARSAWVVVAAPQGASSGAVVRIDGAGRRPLSEGLVDALAPSVRFDGERVLFVAREREGAPASVFDCAADGTDRRVAVRHADDCTGAAWLPDGRVVYAAFREGEPAGARRRSLYVGKGDGSAGERITWGLDDSEPTVLSDGRILFVASRPTANGGARAILCTVHPDGSGLAPFHVGGPESAAFARPRQLASLDVECLALAPLTVPPERIVLSWDAPSVRLATPPAPQGPSAAPDAGETWADAVPLAPRVRPQGHLSSVKPGLGFGTLVAVDARSGGRGVSVRFRSGDDVLGTVPLERDGSFAVRIPSDRPFRTEVLDADGSVVAAELGAMWVRPGETRVCVGCHDDAETGPPNVRPVALTKDAFDLGGTGGRR